MTVQPNFNPKLPRQTKQNRLRFIIAISLLALLGVEERKKRVKWRRGSYRDRLLSLCE